MLNTEGEKLVYHDRKCCISLKKMPDTMRKDVVYHDRGCCMPLKSRYRIMYAMKEAAVYHEEDAVCPERIYHLDLDWCISLVRGRTFLI